MQEYEHGHSADSKLQLPGGMDVKDEGEGKPTFMDLQGHGQGMLSHYAGHHYPNPYINGYGPMDSPYPPASSQGAPHGFGYPFGMNPPASFSYPGYSPTRGMGAYPDHYQNTVSLMNSKLDRLVIYIGSNILVNT